MKKRIAIIILALVVLMVTPIIPNDEKDPSDIACYETMINL